VVLVKYNNKKLRQVACRALSLQPVLLPFHALHGEIRIAEPLVHPHIINGNKGFFRSLDILNDCLFPKPEPKVILPFNG
jgi:hypothetical protein